MKKKFIAILSLTLAASSAFTMTTFAAERKAIIPSSSDYEVGYASSDYVVSSTGYDAETNTSTGPYILPESAKHSLSENELSNLTDYELFLARNEIFARYGVMFKDEKLNQFFCTKSWYHPTISAEELNAEDMDATDKQNVQTLLTYEKRRGSQFVPGAPESIPSPLGSITKQEMDAFVEELNYSFGQSLTFDTAESRYSSSVGTTLTKITYKELTGDSEVFINIGLDGTIYVAGFSGMGFETENEITELFCQRRNISGYDKENFAACVANNKEAVTDVDMGLYKFTSREDGYTGIVYKNL
ncbi:YARHG domain-containing protein [Hespellia stercorisuis]|uniref:YARHG domain-containing protein n=1 Tax=Hespellia stercorisuis DSM 15480 TaxID=1121950 RepID=A0A1M6R5Q2_9FIRM|nr:YARHG domain-containing protein [Hespellia stercorisuis]SHK27784.1 YARHG domain-containing protein [Hespellia stercorisuis DSM 15480]